MGRAAPRGVCWTPWAGFPGLRRPPVGSGAASCLWGPADQMFLLNGCRHVAWILTAERYSEFKLQETGPCPFLLCQTGNWEVGEARTGGVGSWPCTGQSGSRSCEDGPRRECGGGVYQVPQTWTATGGRGVGGSWGPPGITVHRRGAGRVVSALVRVRKQAWQPNRLPGVAQLGPD